MAVEKGLKARLGGADLAASSRDIGELHVCIDGLGVESQGLFELGDRGCNPTISQKQITGVHMFLRRFRL